MKKIPSAKPSPELWRTTCQWLKACGYKVNNNYCKEEITTHPDYPALLSAIDFLDSGGLAYKAIQADASYLHEFNYPLLAHIRQPGLEYLTMIQDATEWDKQKEITEHWTGVAVFPEKNARWQNEQNDVYQKRAIRNRLTLTAWILVGGILYTASIFRLHNFSLNLFGFLSLLGIVISLLALGTELGFHNQLIKQVCGAMGHGGGCEKVLKSRYAEGVAGITPADVSLLYFTAQFIAYLLGLFYAPLLQTIPLLAFAGIFVIGWSIYTQAVKLKEWCALCLAIVAVLFFQAVIAFSVPVTPVDYPGLSSVMALFLVLSLVLFPIKKLLKTNIHNTLKLAELKKWKLDGELFVNQWQQEHKVDTTIWENDLLLGSPDAPIQITVACNPYCGPCARTHKVLGGLLDRYAGKVKVQMRFLFNPQIENDRLTAAVKSILQKAVSVQNNTELIQMVSDWFEWMDPDKWESKWQPDRTIDVSPLLQQHTQWIEDSNITYTPTIFLNGRKLPGRYSLTDMEMLIPQLVVTYIAILNHR